MGQGPDLGLLRRTAQPASATAGETYRMVSEDPPPRRWKTRVLVPASVLVAALGILAFAARGALRPAVAVEIVPTVARTGVQAAGTAVVQAPGWVEPDPFFISVSALADGVVQEVTVLEGDTVTKGQVVARLVPDEAKLALGRAEAELREHEAHLRTAQALVREAERNWEHPIELRRKVATTEALLAEKKAELDQWPALVEAERAKLAELQDAYDRVRRARADSQGALSEQELVRAQQQYEGQKAVLASTEARKPILEAQIRNLEAELQAAREALELRIADTRALDEAKARLAEAESAVQRARAARDEAKLRLDRMEIRSPVDGVVSQRLVQPGSNLMLNTDMPTGSQVMRLYDPRKLQVRVDVPLSEAALVRVGQPAEIVVGSLPNRTFTGQVTRVVHEADIQKNTLQFKVAIHDPAPEIKPEMLARVKFLAPPTTQPAETAVLFVPSQLVRQTADGTAVWLYDQANKRAEFRPVVLGTARYEDAVEVREGLRLGDWLIANPPADLKPGDAVRVVGEARNGHAAHHGGQS